MPIKFLTERVLKMCVSIRIASRLATGNLNSRPKRGSRNGFRRNRSGACYDASSNPRYWTRPNDLSLRGLILISYRFKCQLSRRTSRDTEFDVSRRRRFPVQNNVDAILFHISVVGDLGMAIVFIIIIARV